MRWPVVALVGYVLIGLELTVRRALAIGPPDAATIAPSFIIPFLVFVAMSAPVVPTLWVALLMGLAVDIRSPRDGGTLLVVGPYAIGYMAGAYLVVTMRGLMFRRNPLSVMFLSLLASLLAELIVVAFFSIRGMYSATDFSAGRELVHRLLSSVYTALTTAWVLALVFLPMTNLFGFQEQHARRFAGRRT